MSVDLTIVIPTVTGREENLAALKENLSRTAPDATLLIFRDRATCGEVWNHGADQATTQYVTMLADDLLPHPGWWQAAAGVVERGFIPAPYLWTATPEGRTFESGGGWQAMMGRGMQTGWSAVPFCRPTDWTPIPPIHYFSDNAYTDAMAAKRIVAIVEPGFAFDHTWAQAARQQMQGARWYAEQGEWERFRANLPRT